MISPTFLSGGRKVVILKFAGRIMGGFGWAGFDQNQNDMHTNDFPRGTMKSGAIRRGTLRPQFGAATDCF
jgi:hypothetical protein